MTVRPRDKTWLQSTLVNDEQMSEAPFDCTKQLCFGRLINKLSMIDGTELGGKQMQERRGQHERPNLGVT